MILYYISQSLLSVKFWFGLLLKGTSRMLEEGKIDEYGSEKKVVLAESCLNLWDLPSSSVHGLLQTRILEWVAMPISRGISLSRDQTQVFLLQVDTLPFEPPGKPQKDNESSQILCGSLGHWGCGWEYGPTRAGLPLDHKCGDMAQEPQNLLLVQWLSRTTRWGLRIRIPCPHHC